MHLLIPFAYGSSRGCEQVLGQLQLPHLQRLLRRLRAGDKDHGDMSSYSPPHERALARVLGLPVRDGEIPWAAWHARPEPGAWAFVSPCHWVMGSDEVTMSPAALADFPEHESRALLASMQAFFAGDGIELIYDQPQRWLARGAALEGMFTAAADRVAGRAVRDWPARGAGAPLLRRLHAEMQMLCYQHPVNDARQARGVEPVNSFWLSGTGALGAGASVSSPADAITLANELRDAALQEDWAAWAGAWHAVDAKHCASLLHAIEACGSNAVELARCKLSLCGQRNALTLDAVPPSWWHGLKHRMSSQRPSDVLGQL